ncbi:MULTISPECIES: helix-turn-helix transcriptional regulator [unclassified Eikenella]|uniref:helix-turn-helix transcriptional regulator n=1 Tax=unclassified Eikenella TaxID=2639367 RepID=UPI00163B2F02|nr:MULTISPECIES: LuxR C-terminal-related transcriptional regulator [unclassified Eikenella]
MLHCAAGGISNKMIVWRMFLSENTVKAYMQIIFRKLNIDNCVCAAVYARELGLDK